MTAIPMAVNGEKSDDDDLSTNSFYSCQSSEQEVDPEEQLKKTSTTRSTAYDGRKSISASIIDFMKSKDGASFVQQEDSDVIDLVMKDNGENNASKVLNEEEKWPDLYNLAWSMVDGSQMIYQVIWIRQLAREGKLPNCERALTLPLTIDDSLSLIEEHQDILEKYMGKSETRFFTETTENAALRMAPVLQKEGLTVRDLETGTGDGKFHQGIIAVDDENDMSGLVYGIGINSLTKRVLVVFRGTATMADVKTDLDFVRMKKMPNPLKDHEGQPKYISIHSGFHKYLYGTTNKQLFPHNKDTDESKLDNKFNDLLSQIAEILKAFPGYTLYVTGHSLGGALASLFSFSAACCDLPQIKKPIRCISIASPKAGNVDFRSAFELLEEQNKIRCIRIVNNKDIVPMSPDQPLYITKPIMQKNVYHHVGIQLKLYEYDDGVRVTYRRLRKGANRVGYDLAVLIRKHLFFLTLCATGCYGAPRAHFCDEYADRIHKHAHILKTLDIPSLYEVRFKEPDREILFCAKKDKF